MKKNEFWDLTLEDGEAEFFTGDMVTMIAMKDPFQTQPRVSASAIAQLAAIAAEIDAIDADFPDWTEGMRAAAIRGLERAMREIAKRGTRGGT